MCHQVEDEIRQFFIGYGRTVMRDAAALAGLWEYPAHSTRFDQRLKSIEQFPIPSRDEFIRSVEATDRRFRAWGFRVATIDVTAIAELSEGLLQVRTHWQFLDRASECTADATAIYTLGRFDRELRVVQAIWLGLVPRARRSLTG